MKMSKREYNVLLWEQKRYDELYTENLPFMHFKMKYAYTLGIPECDIQTCIDNAFLKAIKNFDPTRGEFTTALGWTLKGEMGIYNRKKKKDDNIVWYDEFLQDDSKESSKSLDYLESQAHGFTVESPLEIYMVVNEDNSYLYEALSGLTDKEREVLVRYYMEKQNQPQIADLMGLSQVQVSRCLKKSLSKMRTLMNIEEPEHAPVERNQQTTKESCYKAFSAGLDNEGAIKATGLAYSTIRKFRTMYNKEMGKEPTRGRKHKVC